MKTIAEKTAIFIFFMIFLFPFFGFCQSKIEGKWEGNFMTDFKTILQISADENNNFTGNIKMFSGEQMIQNDTISKISLNQNILTFFIDAKETGFKGELINKNSDLKGAFVFPDKSEHPIFLIKNVGENSVQNEKANSFSDLKNYKYNMEELRLDYNFMIEKLKEFHPQLYSCISKEDFENLSVKTEAKLNTELTLSEFFILISPVTESIKCSHTGIRLPSDYENLNRQFGNYLPLELFFDGQKLYCLQSFNSSETSFRPCDEILSINQLSVSEIKNLMYPLIPVERQNESAKIYQINQYFNSLFNLIDDSEQFQIVALRNNSELEQTVDACTFSQLENGKIGSNQTPLNFYIEKENDLGILKISSFMFVDVNNYIQQMDEIFTTLKTENIEKLLIDLRGNQGGHPIFAAQLLSYLVDSDFVYFERNKDVPDFEPLYHPMQANTIHFDGELFVLVDGGCLSTTGHFISLLKYHTSAVFAGQQPGSTFRCNDFSIKETLPNTKIEINIPRTTFKTTVAGYFEKHPFELDYRMDYRIEDRLHGEDIDLEFLTSIFLQP